MNPEVLTVYKSPFTKLRLGQDNDGGYIIADIPNVNYATFLAGGLGDDVTFEEAFMSKYQIPTAAAFAFDGTIDDPPAFSSSIAPITFIKKNIGYENNETTTNLHDIINANDGIFVKMDIEGGEIHWIKSLSNNQMSKFDQIVMEFHFPFSDNEIEVFDKLNANHYLVHFHPNNCCGVRMHNGVRIPNVFECTYLHKKYFTAGTPELNKELIPGPLDMKNTHNSDIHIDYPPFVHLTSVIHR